MINLNCFKEADTENEIIDAIKADNNRKKLGLTECTSNKYKAFCEIMDFFFSFLFISRLRSFFFYFFL